MSSAQVDTSFLCFDLYMCVHIYKVIYSCATNCGGSLVLTSWHQSLESSWTLVLITDIGLSNSVRGLSKARL